MRSTLRKHYARHGLAASVILLCLLLCGILWTDLYVQMHLERERILESKRHENDNLARVFEEHVARTIRAAEITLGEIASEYRRYGTKFDLIQYAKSRGTALDPYTGLSIVNEKGDRILTSFPVPPGTLNLSTTPDYQYLARHDAPEIYISGPRLGVATGKWTVFLSLRINKPDRSFGGYAVIGMNPTYFSTIYSELELGEDSVVTLVGRDGIIRARSKGANVTAGQSVANSELFRRLSVTNHGSYIVPGILDQVARIFSYRALKDYPLVVVIGTSRAAALSSHDNNTSIQLRAAGAVTAAILGLGFFVLVQIRRKDKANEALRASEEKFSKAFHASPDSIALSKLATGELLEVNEGFERLTGLSRSEAIGRTAVELGLWPQPQQRAALAERLAAGGVVHGLETVMRRPDGAERIVLIWLEALYIDGEKCMLTAGRDITERKSAEEALRAGARRLNEAQRIAKVGNWNLDLVANRLTWSDEIFRMFEIDKERFGATYEAFLNAIHPEDRDAVDAAYTRSVETREPYEIAHRLRMPDGRIKWVRERCETYYEGDGRPLRSAGTVQDITEEIRAQESLRESSERFQKFFEVSPDSITLVTLDGGRFVHVSNGFERFTGWTAAEAIGRTALDLGLWTDTSQRDFMFTELRAGRTVRDLEAVIRRKDGALRVGLRFSTVVEFGGVQHILSIMRDITDRKRAETEILELNADLERRVRERTAKLEAANRELETFSYSVAHDLKAPLRGIDGYSLLLLEDYAGKLDDTGRQFLANVRSATLQMGELINDLLAYSRLERQDMRAGEVEAKPLVEALLAERADEIRRRGVAVSVALPFVSVNADREGLAMALRNLLENALKFTRDVAHPAIEVGGRDEDGARLLWVRDNGPGFDMKFHDRIFAIFQRLHRMEDYPGTGIGLAIVKKAIERMGGRAWAESAPGQGATFVLELPGKAASP